MLDIPRFESDTTIPHPHNAINLYHPKNRLETIKTVTLRLPDYLAETLPAEESSLCEILKLGLKQFRIEWAIKRYKKGGVSLAKDAELAGVSIREMISIAYAHGLEPRYDE
ncbi:antitoxin [Methanosarcinales archaeon]|nr:MAG: antitoxin [Methanosarcinales archaeon]